MTKKTMAHNLPSPSTSQSWQNSTPQQSADMSSRRTRIREGTPTGSAFGSISGFSDSAASVRGPIPHMYSTSYGSPLAQLPDRNPHRGGGDFKKVAAEMFSTIVRDDGEAQFRRQSNSRRGAGNASQNQAADPAAPFPPAPAPRPVAGRGRGAPTEPEALNARFPPASPTKSRPTSGASKDAPRASPSASQRAPSKRTVSPVTSSQPTRVTRSKRQAVRKSSSEDSDVLESLAPITTASQPAKTQSSQPPHRKNYQSSSDSSQHSELSDTPETSSGESPPTSPSSKTTSQQAARASGTSSKAAATAIASSQLLSREIQHDDQFRDVDVGRTEDDLGRRLDTGKESDDEELLDYEEPSEYEQREGSVEVEYDDDEEMGEGEEEEEDEDEELQDVEEQDEEERELLAKELKDDLLLHHGLGQPKDVLHQKFQQPRDVAEKDVLSVLPRSTTNDKLQGQLQETYFKQPQRDLIVAAGRAEGQTLGMQRPADRAPSTRSTDLEAGRQEAADRAAADATAAQPAANERAAREAAAERAGNQHAKDQSLIQQAMNMDDSAAPSPNRRRRRAMSNPNDEQAQRRRDKDVNARQAANAEVARKNLARQNNNVDQPPSPARSFVEENGIYAASDVGAAPTVIVAQGQPRVAPIIDVNTARHQRAINERAEQLNRFEDNTSFSGQLRSRAAQPGGSDPSDSSSSDPGDRHPANNPPRKHLPKNPTKGSQNGAPKQQPNATKQSSGFFGGSKGVVSHFLGSNGNQKTNTAPTGFPQPRAAVPGKGSFSCWRFLFYFIAAFVAFNLLFFVADQLPGGSELSDGTSGSLWSRLPNIWPNNDGWTSPAGSGLSDNQFLDLRNYLDTKLKKTDETIKRLNDILPGAIFARKDKSGKVIIDNDFWDALRTLIRKDGSIFALDDKSRLTDKHWRAIQDRLGSDRTISKQWSNWLKKNEGKVKEIVEHPEKAEPGDTVISRTEVRGIVQKALEKSKQEIDKEMDALRKEVHGLIRGIQVESGTGTGSPRSGLSREEITSLVKKAVTQEVSDRQLALAAKTGKISTLDAQLRLHQTNQFAIGNGAFIDATLTSPTWVLRRYPDGSKMWAKIRHPQYQIQAIHSLSEWTEPGHCWCAAVQTTNGKFLPADLGVRLQNFVIPRHLVVEHINPALSIDSKSMPKEMEIWGVYDIPDRRARIKKHSLKAYPNQDKRLVRQGLFQLGHFEYKYNPKDEGVFIYELEKTLQDIDAATDEIIVRAVSNVGKVDHTCFYRVRLYGHEREGLERTGRKDWAEDE
ncbi:hypothetical protein QBC43DRAFT_320206 [Cladorrhinum sp. PSN259]|nr:hypothetical protein QBC43DRAFT_320206 [Cladorrhinum sp. PSN259]